MQPVAFPSDFQALVSLIISQAWIGILISWLIAHVPFVQKDSVANWIKVVFIAVVCLAWSLFATVVTSHGLPQTPDAWYGVVYLALVVLFTNQAFYGLVDKIPALRDFVLQLFGKPAA